MKKLLSCLAVSCLLLLPPVFSRAEDFTGSAADLGTTARPPIASATDVAMMYWQLARKSPNFEAMARSSDQYKKATDFERESVLNAVKADLRNSFDNVSFSHPSVVDLKVTLSPYSSKNKGFAITNLEEQTFFKYSFAGENYAIVPRKLMDHQFLGPIEDYSFVSKILGSQKTYGGVFHLMIYLKPDFADPPEQLTEVDNEKFHIISGEVAHVALYDAQETQQLWGDNSEDFNKGQQDQLMNLKQ
jgi:hypothetical protein